jgi:hypothetical protein
MTKKIHISIFFIIAVFIFSCNGRLLSSNTASVLNETSSYCALLHLPSEPYPVPQPKPYLGIYLSSRKLEEPVPSCKEGFFVQVAGVIDGSPAAESGLAEEDIILALNGSSACGGSEDPVSSFKKIVEQQRIGRAVHMDILRGGQKLTVSIIPVELPVHDQPEAAHSIMESCKGSPPSVLEITAHKEDALALLNRVTEGLYYRSNAVHNLERAGISDHNALQLQEMTYMMRHPLTAGEVASELSDKIMAPLLEDEWELKEMVKRSAGLIDLKLNYSTATTEFSFPALVRTIKDTKKEVELALSNLAPEEKSILLKNALDPGEKSQWNTISEISMKIDRGKLLNAFSSLLSFLSKDSLLLLKEDLINRFGNIRGPLYFQDSDNAVKVIIGGFGPDVYSEDADLILDPGGDDLYLNNAGGTRKGMPVSLVIDWEGNDRYITQEPFSQGAGVLGGGFLFDLAGDDTFVSLDGSQGAGFWGMGILYHGDGNASFSARSFCQGTGQFGLGIIINAKGNDRYICSYGGQALGMFGGAGVLIDKSGDDLYRLGGLHPDFREPYTSTVSMGQGFGQGIRAEKAIRGVPGGIGVLIDEKGNDTYIADYFAQGSSYYYGTGILLDMDGNDEYVSGRYSQGAGIHSSVGICIDRRGNDFYYASYGVAQGTGHDFGIGFFEDGQGDDEYWGGTLVQGSASNGSIGIFKDLRGSDRYTCKDKGQAFAQESDGIGIMITPTADASGDYPASIKLGIKK